MSSSELLLRLKPAASKARKNTIFLLAMGFLALIFLGAVIYGANAGVTRSTKRLLLANVICRHGARTPVDTYPTDPFRNHSFAPIGWGHLTNEGKLDMYRLGKELRTRYDRLLGPLYAPGTYRAQSTDSDRTIASVQLVNAGLWEPYGSQRWGPINWQPVPVRYEPLNEDTLLLVRVPCAQYEIELEKIAGSEPVRELLKRNKSLFDYIQTATGKPIRTFDDIQDVYTTLQAETAFNLTLPLWTHGYFPDKMYGPTAFSFKLRAYNKRLIRLKGGLLLRKLVDDIKTKTNETAKSELKVFLYGGHDSTIANILSALNLFREHVPDYAATVLVELYVDGTDNQYYIEVYYKTSPRDRFEAQTIPGCETSCPLNTFLELIGDYIPTNWTEECHSADPNYIPPPPIGP